jgi:hypothetical protein
MPTIHTETLVTVAKFLKGDSDNKWGFAFILIIAGNSSVQFLIDAVTPLEVNGVPYTCRIGFSPDTSLFNWRLAKDNIASFHRVDKPTLNASQSAKDKLTHIAINTVNEVSDAFPDVFDEADNHYLTGMLGDMDEKEETLRRQMLKLSDDRTKLIRERSKRWDKFQHLIRHNHP